MQRPTPVAGREPPRMGARTARLESGRAQLESSMRSLTRSRSPPRARPLRQARRTLARPGQAGRAASARNCRARSDERASGPSPGRGNCLGSADATPARETPQAGTRPSPDAPAGRALRRCPDTISTSASRAHAGTQRPCGGGECELLWRSPPPSPPCKTSAAHRPTTIAARDPSAASRAKQHCSGRPPRAATLLRCQHLDAAGSGE
jgi:hypothetical protein